MQDSRLPLRGVALVVLVGSAWGLTYALYPVGLERAGPVWLSALRFETFCVGALVAARLVDGGVRLPVHARDFAAVAVYGGLSVVLHNLATIGGSAHVPVAVVGIMAGSTPLLTAAFAWVLPPRSRFGARTGAGLALGFAGVLVLALARGGGFGVSPWALVVLGGFAAWALATVLLRNGGSTLPILSVGFWGALVAAVVLQALALATEPLPEADATLAGVVLWIGLGGGVGGFVGWLTLVRRAGSRPASLTSYVSPVVASLVGLVFLGQPLGLRHAVAYVLIAGGLVLAAQETDASASPPGTVPATPADARDAAK